ncbi:hypothetical protein LOK49_Contig452G00002, partial [Camellia lanceoleosa]
IGKWSRASPLGLTIVLVRGRILAAHQSNGIKCCFELFLGLSSNVEVAFMNHHVGWSYGLCEDFCSS